MSRVAYCGDKGTIVGREDEELDGMMVSSIQTHGRASEKTVDGKRIGD